MAPTQYNMLYEMYLIPLERAVQIAFAEIILSMTVTHLQSCYYLFCDVERLAVGLLVEPHTAVRLSNNGVVRLLQPLWYKKQH